MVIENLRHVRKKWKIPMAIGVGVIVLGLLSSYAFLGSSFGVSGTSNKGISTVIENLEAQTRSLDKAMKAAPEDPAAAAAAAQSHDSLARFYGLALNDKASAQEYQAAMDCYATAAGLYGDDTEASTWSDLYSGWYNCYAAQGNYEEAWRIFNEGVPLTQKDNAYLTDYFYTMNAANQNELLVSQFTALKDTLDPEADASFISTIDMYVGYAESIIKSQLEAKVNLEGGVEEEGEGEADTEADTEDKDKDKDTEKDKE